MRELSAALGPLRASLPAGYFIDIAVESSAVQAAERLTKRRRHMLPTDQ
jgi:hypothetical protein